MWLLGPSFALAAKVLLDKWHARGLNDAILARIRNQVFAIGEPVPRARRIGDGRLRPIPDVAAPGLT
jgi:hypothetical protein